MDELIEACVCIRRDDSDYHVSVDQLKLWKQLYNRYEELGRPSMMKIDTKIPHIALQYIMGNKCHDEVHNMSMEEFRKLYNANVVPHTIEFIDYILGCKPICKPMTRLQHFLDEYGEEDGSIEYCNYLVQAVTGKTVNEIEIGDEILPEKSIKFRVHKWNGNDMPKDKEVVVQPDYAHLNSIRDTQPFRFWERSKNCEYNDLLPGAWPNLKNTDLEIISE